MTQPAALTHIGDDPLSSRLQFWMDQDQNTRCMFGVHQDYHISSPSSSISFLYSPSCFLCLTFDVLSATRRIMGRMGIVFFFPFLFFSSGKGGQASVSLLETPHHLHPNFDTRRLTAANKTSHLKIQKEGERQRGEEKKHS